MAVTGAAAVRRNIRRALGNIEERRAPQFINAVLSIGLNHSKELAPLEFSTLVNSAFTEVGTGPNGPSGTLTYNTNYAAALEFREDWQPRPISEKSGPATNMDATPHYLQKGFEDPESQAAIRRAEGIFRI
jgi:hypothetical protein